MAKRPKPEKQASAVSHAAVGEIVVSAVNDGVFEVSLDDLVNIDRAACEAAHRSAFRAEPPLLTINTFLVHAGDKLALIDSGFARKTDSVGNTVDNLATIGIAPEDIDVVLMTHMHPDHEAGLTDGHGRAAFPNAELFLHEDELAFWTDDGALSRAPEAARGDFALAREALAAYAGRVTTIRDGVAIPGIRSLPTPGHTPGHTAWLVESDGDALLVWGDIVHFPGVQFAFPEASVAFDLDAAAAATARRRMLDIVATERLRVAGIHLDYPCFGRVVHAGSGYSYIPEVWRPKL